jgi:hypothetical protein
MRLMRIKTGLGGRTSRIRAYATFFYRREELLSGALDLTSYTVYYDCYTCECA